jgi:hypothetical protein
MAMVHQEIGAVFFGRDGVRIGLGNALHYFGALDVHFVTTGRALLGPNLAAQNDGRFLSQVFQCVKERCIDVGFHRDALHGAAAVAQKREDDLAGLAQVVKPSGDFHLFTGVLSGVFDSDSGVRAHVVLLYRLLTRAARKRTARKQAARKCVARKC